MLKGRGATDADLAGLQFSNSSPACLSRRGTPRAGMVGRRQLRPVQGLHPDAEFLEIASRRSAYCVLVNQLLTTFVSFGRYLSLAPRHLSATRTNQTPGPRAEPTFGKSHNPRR
jgi:hypothetical protein